MRRLPRHLPVLILSFLLLAVPTGKALATGPIAVGCDAEAVCSYRLGVSIVAAPGWTQLPHVPTSEIDFARLRPRAVDQDIRLVIRAFATTSDTNSARAASTAANLLVSEFSATHPHVTRQRVTYSGATGLLLRGLPPTPQPAADIVLAHDHVIYLIIAPGSTLSTDQRQALASLQFVDRSGSFPIEPHLVILPTIVPLGHRFQVTLIGAHPDQPYSFVAAPHRTGFGGGNMGRRRTDNIGAVTFTYPAFTRKAAAGQWTVTVYDARGKKVTTAPLEVTVRSS
jgi:hypothetical protein